MRVDEWADFTPPKWVEYVPNKTVLDSQLKTKLHSSLINHDGFYKDFVEEKWEEKKKIAHLNYLEWIKREKELEM